MNNFFKVCSETRSQQVPKRQKTCLVCLFWAVCILHLPSGPLQSTFLPLSHLFPSPIAHLNHLRKRALFPTYDS